MVALLERGSAKKGRTSRTSALAIAALCVGGMVIARASEGHALATELRKAAMDVALKLGGWDGKPNPKRAQSKRHNPKNRALSRGGNLSRRSSKSALYINIWNVSLYAPSLPLNDFRSW